MTLGHQEEVNVALLCTKIEEDCNYTYKSGERLKTIHLP